MLDHYVMFKIKPGYRKDLPAIVRRLKQLRKSVPAILFSEVITDKLHGKHSFDVMFHIRVKDTAAFKKDYMLHPRHIPVQKYIEKRVCGIADIDVLHKP